ncbi:unnamed protein product [Adineta steineri]|uniref:Uncharacterized protein n=1 Tax=Adineta steineri TaxID=433720 RepID=A0A818G562_9BILA|nr:unnamed protein product [Adineta steineri]
MDSSRSSLPNVDRANSTLFKRYLDEQHKSVVKSTNYPSLSRPINTSIQITHTHRQHQQQQQQQQNETYITPKSNNNNSNQQVMIKRKFSTGRKPSGDTSKQRVSHTSRFMKRFQRQHKNGETITNVQKHDGGRARFEFHDPPSTIKPVRTDQDTRCTCLISSNRHGGDCHHSLNKTSQVPRLSLNELFHATSQHRQKPVQESIAPPISPKSILPPTIDESIRQGESVTNFTYPVEQNRLSSPSITINTESEIILHDNPSINISNEYWPLINDFLHEISIEMNDKPNVDMLLEIEESLAQRIYDCIVEQDDDEHENDTQSYSTPTNNSSILSVPQPPPPPLNNRISQESNILPPSPISTTTKDREKYFQPIREPPISSFNNLLDRNRHSTPFNHLSKQIENDGRSPFAQSLFEPVNLLRTVTTNDNDDFNFFPPSFSFNNQNNINTDLTLLQQSKGELSQTTSYHPSLPFLNHLLPSRTTPIDTNISAFKPIESTNMRSTTSFALKRPQVKSTSSTGTNWFGQS